MSIDTISAGRDCLSPNFVVENSFDRKSPSSSFEVRGCRVFGHVVDQTARFNWKGHERAAKCDWGGASWGTGRNFGVYNK